MKPLPLYVRRVRSDDPALPTNHRRHDVVAYPDPNATRPKARWLWFQKTRPRQGQRTAMLNCYRWTLIWLP